MIKKAIFIFFILIIASSVYAEKMRIAIMDLQAIDVPESTSRAVSDLLRTEMFNTGLFRVIERGEMNAILKEQEFQMGGCTDTECAVEMGRLLSARKMLVGSVSKLGKSFIINARIVDVERGEMEFGEKAKAKSEDDLDTAVEVFAKRIVARIRASQEGEKIEKVDSYVEVKPKIKKERKPGTTTWVGKGGLGLIGAGLLSGGFAFYYNGKAQKAHDYYTSLNKERTVDWTWKEWDLEWEKVENSMNSRDMYNFLGIGAVGAGAVMFIGDQYLLKNSSFLGQAGFLLIGAGVITGGLSYYYHQVAQRSYEIYDGINEYNSISMPEDSWEAKWNKVNDAQKKRDLFLLVGMGAGGAGLVMYVIDTIVLEKNVASTFNNDIYLCLNNGVELAYIYRW